MAAGFPTLVRNSKPLEICERGQKLYPNTEQLENVAVSLPEAALIARTMEHLEQIKKNPRNVDQLIAVGRVMMAADKGKRSVALQLAGTLLERAVQLDPDNAAARYHYGRYMVAQMKPEEAAAAFHKALAVAHDDELQVLILGWTGFVESRLGHLDPADEAFRRSLALNRKLKLPLAESAFHYYKFLASHERDQEGRALLDEILHWEPLFAPALLERAKNLLNQDQPGKAGEAALLVTRNTEDPGILHTAHYLLVKIYTAMGDQKQAQAHAEWIKSH
jgi:Tfp pilus assembly protein PilF